MSVFFLASSTEVKAKANYGKIIPKLNYFSLILPFFSLENKNDKTEKHTLEVVFIKILKFSIQTFK